MSWCANRIWNTSIPQPMLKKLFQPSNQIGSVRYGSAGLKELKNRMRSIKNVQKITKTMKLVASARLKAAQQAMERSRPFGESGLFVLNELQEQKKTLEKKVEGKTKNYLVVTISTDRGLCGSINSSVVKATRSLVKETSKDYKVSIASFGEKGTAQMARYLSSNLVLSASNLSKQPMSFYNASIFLDELLGKEEFNYDCVSIIFNRFISIISFETKDRTFDSYNIFLDQIDQGGLEKFSNYEFDGDTRSIYLRDLFEYTLAVALYQGYVENQAAELGARMNSMDTASNNANEMLKRMAIKYNRGRQAAITTELIEIISGAQALEG